MNNFFAEFIGFEPTDFGQLGITKNILFSHLAEVFGEWPVVETFKEYGVETFFKYGDSPVFIYRDNRGRLVGAKLVEMDPKTGRPYAEGHREKWILKRCSNSYYVGYYGAHLLEKKPNAPALIVEDERSAIIGSLFFKDYVWLATGCSFNSFIPALDTSLTGRKAWFVAMNEKQAEDLRENFVNYHAQILTLDDGKIQKMDPSRHQYLADLLLDRETWDDTIKILSSKTFKYR